MIQNFMMKSGTNFLNTLYEQYLHTKSKVKLNFEGVDRGGRGYGDRGCGIRGRGCGIGGRGGGKRE